MELYKLSAPSAHDLKTIRNWVEMPEGGNHFLRALEAKVFDSPDLVSLLARSKDPFTRWISEKVVPCFHWIVGRRFFKVILQEPLMRIFLIVSAENHRRRFRKWSDTLRRYNTFRNHSYTQYPGLVATTQRISCRPLLCRSSN